MKHPLLVLILFLSTIAINAQDTLLTIDPVPVDTVFLVTQEDLDKSWFDVEAHAVVTNITEETLRLKWVRTSVESPEDWQTKVCDNNTCYNANVSSNIDPMIGLDVPAVMEPGAHFDLIFHLLPKGVSGEGQYEIAFSTVEEPDSILATAIFNFNVSLVSSTNELEKQSIRLFPNPAENYFKLTNNSSVDKIIVYNLVGRPVRTFRAFNGMLYDVSDLPMGMYLVGLISEEKGIIKTLRMTKRSMRP